MSRAARLVCRRASMADWLPEEQPPFPDVGYATGIGGEGPPWPPADHEIVQGRRVLGQIVCRPSKSPRERRSSWPDSDRLRYWGERSWPTLDPNICLHPCRKGPAVTRGTLSTLGLAALLCLGACGADSPGESTGSGGAAPSGSGGSAASGGVRG